MNTPSEADVLLARDGDEAAFHRVVEHTASTVCSIALAIARNVEASEDIAQETFVAVWRDLKKLRNPASFMPWLRQVTRNQAHLWRRRNEREVLDDAILAAATDSAPRPDEALVAAEERRMIREALDALPDDAREVLVLYYREGRSTKQVASLLGISEDAARQRLSRSRTLLREDVLERVGAIAARTAPGAACASAVAVAMTMAAPTASAAVALGGAASGSLGGAAIAKAGILGALLGWLGVFVGLKNLEPYFDEQESGELRRFRNLVLAVVTAGSLVVALGASSTIWTLVTVQSLYGAIAFLYLVRLPKILERRMEWEKSLDPELAKQGRRQWMWATISGALSAAIGGSVLMAMLLFGMRGR